MLLERLDRAHDSGACQAGLRANRVERRIAAARGEVDEAEQHLEHPKPVAAQRPSRSPFFL
jgi:hypothetical protein